MPERFLIRTTDGPNVGTRVAEGWAWPLPELLLTEGGSYVKISESQLAPMSEGSGLLRGAEYRWQPGDATADQLASAIHTELKAHRVREAHALLYPLAIADPQMAADIRDTLLLGVALSETAPASIRDASMGG
jgi:hypothetical protein